MLPTDHPYISADILRRYLPGLWRRHADRFPPTRSLHPELYLPPAEVVEETWIALRYLFWYLAAMDETIKNRKFLLKSLDSIWDNDGHRRAKRVFLALGRILLPQNLGCNKEIWRTMGTFVIKHSREISVSDWIEYIKILDEIEPSGMFELKYVLRCFNYLHPIRPRDLQHHHLIQTLGPRPLQLLDRLIEQGDGNAHRFGTRGGHPPCPHFTWDLDGRRGQSFPWWTESLDDQVPSYGQCGPCFTTFGPYYTRQRPAAPRAHSAHALHHVAHRDHYETESSPWELSDFRRNIPRSMRPFLHDGARYEDWLPRHGRVVEVVS